jgi:hypothetical protein
MSSPYPGEQYGSLVCCDSNRSQRSPTLAPFVVSLNGLYGLLTLEGGTGVEITSLSSVITISIDTSSVLALPYTGTNFRIQADGTIQIKNSDTGLFHDIGSAGADGSSYLTFNDTGEA